MSSKLVRLYTQQNTFQQLKNGENPMRVHPMRVHLMHRQDLSPQVAYCGSTLRDRLQRYMSDLCSRGPSWGNRKIRQTCSASCLWAMVEKLRIRLHKHEAWFYERASINRQFDLRPAFYGNNHRRNGVPSEWYDKRVWYDRQSFDQRF